MKHLKQYRIPFSGLAAGKHDFEFEIDDKFFDCFDQSLVKRGKLVAAVQLEKQETMLIARFDIKGIIRLTCDVCLSEFDAPLDFQERLFVKFVNEEWGEDTEEVVILNKNDHELDIANYLYEYINVRVPYFPKCTEQGIDIECDPDMLVRLDNNVQSSSEEIENIDPRWAALKNIKNN
ncbi:MAG TPA: DUF177 domain-containing protein [Sphingobacterium sp.]|nr:DUF177 domain-containing protein [Sphingobacterium sp.]